MSRIVLVAVHKPESENFNADLCADDLPAFWVEEEVVAVKHGCAVKSGYWHMRRDETHRYWKLGVGKTYRLIIEELD